MNQNKSVTAIFSQESYNLTDQVVGGGSISLDPDQNSYMVGDVVTVTAIADPGWGFDGWSGDFNGSTVSQSLTIDSHKSITATFTQDAYIVTTTISGNGSVILNPDQAGYAYGDQIAVQALPDPGYTFQGWSGDLSGNAPLENLTIDSSKAITAMFTSAVYSVETSVLGSGSITVEPDQTDYSYGDVITATATPAAGWSFSGWQLGLSGMTATQALTITGDTNLLAVFAADAYTLNASWIGDGSVVVTPDRPNYSYGQVVTVTATPGTGWNFTGWSGDISDTALTSTVTMTANRSILATFTPITYTLTVQKDGSGSGTVSAALGGVDCGSDCSEPLDYGSVITLTAIPDAGSTFDGWAGPGIAGGTLFTVTIIGETVVTATFNGGPVNNPPVLDPIGPQTITETLTLTFITVATDANDDTLAFSLSDAPDGAVISATTGLFSWTPTEADGPGVFSPTVIVSDGVLTDSQTIQITVTEQNEAPVLEAIGDQTVTAGEAISFTAVATDTDVPTQTLTYSLSEAPIGAEIVGTTGVFSWTTSTAGVYSATVIVSDGVLTDSQTAAITVTEGAGVIMTESGGSTEVDEAGTLSAGYFLSLTIQPADAVTITIQPDAQLTTSQTSLVFTPNDWDSPQVILVSAVDDLLSEGPHTGQISHTVSSADPRFDGLSAPVLTASIIDNDTPPTLDLIPDQTVDEGEAVTFTAVATDADGEPGDISRAAVSMALVPVGPGSTAPGECVVDGVTGTGYDAAVQVTCSFDEVPVNTYTAEVTVDGGYYRARGEDVLSVYDPSLGYASGSGWFYWPGTTERTTFGLTMSYNKNGKKVKGGLLIIRHLVDGSIYRIKSNSLESLSLGEDRPDNFGWASIAGKATYLEPEWAEPEGNHDFLIYVEDGNEPGDGVDRFWLEMKDKDDQIIPAMSMDREAVDNAVALEDGNIVVPHGPGVNPKVADGNVPHTLFLPLIFRSEAKRVSEVTETSEAEPDSAPLLK